jgi:hypothetical protein
MAAFAIEHIKAAAKQLSGRQLDHILVMERGEIVDFIRRSPEFRLN